jgi:hypothetical protein
MGHAAKGPGDEEICRHDLTHYGRAKTRLRKAYVAAASFGKHAFQARARRSLRRRPRRFCSARPLVMLPHAPGLSHTLPADLE